MVNVKKISFSYNNREKQIPVSIKIISDGVIDFSSMTAINCINNYSNIPDFMCIFNAIMERNYDCKKLLIVTDNGMIEIESGKLKKYEDKQSIINKEGDNTYMVSINIADGKYCYMSDLYGNVKISSTLSNEYIDYLFAEAKKFIDEININIAKHINVKKRG